MWGGGGGGGEADDPWRQHWGPAGGQPPPHSPPVTSAHPSSLLDPGRRVERGEWGCGAVKGCVCPPQIVLHDSPTPYCLHSPPPPSALGDGGDGGVGGGMGGGVGGGGGAQRCMLRTRQHTHWCLHCYHGCHRLLKTCRKGHSQDLHLDFFSIANQDWSATSHIGYTITNAADDTSTKICVRCMHWHEWSATVKSVIGMLYC